jgi:hypothetical protein
MGSAVMDNFTGTAGSSQHGEHAVVILAQITALASIPTLETLEALLLMTGESLLVYFGVVTAVNQWWSASPKSTRFLLRPIVFGSSRGDRNRSTSQ